MLDWDLETALNLNLERSPKSEQNFGQADLSVQRSFTYLCFLFG